MTQQNTTNSDRPWIARRAGRVAVFSLLGVAAVVVLGVTAWGTGILGARADAPDAAPDSSASRSSDNAEWYQVDKRSFDLIVIASGELVAKNQVEIKSQVEGTTQIVEIVPEGTSVKAGDRLAKLADEKIKERIEQVSLDLVGARSNAIAAQQALAIMESQAQSKRSDAQLSLDMATLDLEKWIKGTDVQQRRDLDLALEKAQRTLVRDNRDLELSRELYKEKFISLSELEDGEIKALESKNALETARQNASVYEQYTRPMEERRMRSAVDQTRASLERTIRENESELEKLRADLQSKQRTLKIREDTLANQEQQLAATDIKAPSDGVVVYASSVGPRWRRNEPVAQGANIRFNESIILLPDTRQMVAALKVHEALLSSVQIDQKVSVSIDARPSQPIEGKVSTIAVTAEDGGWMNPDLREYIVRVDMEAGADETLKPGMRCSGRILIGQVKDAMAVPVQAVVREGQKTFVYAPASSGKVQRQSVKIGRASETFVEILEGLNSGDRVLLRKPRPGETVSR